MIALDCQALSFSYPGREVLRDVGFSLSGGEWVGLVGPNGSGKTTLVRLLSGLLSPGEGKVSVYGKELEHLTLRERAKVMATVSQENHFAFPFRVQEAVLLGRYPHLGGLALEGTEDLAIVRRVLERLGLKGYENRLVTDLSGGEKQRVILARALAQEPKVLLLDEPTTFLDLGQALHICRLLKELTREGLAILSVFHDLNLASAFCDRLLVLRQGHFEAIGEPREVLTQAMLREVFGAEVQIQHEPTSGLPYYVPVPGAA